MDRLNELSPNAKEVLKNVTVIIDSDCYTVLYNDHRRENLSFEDLEAYLSGIYAGTH